MDCNRPNAVSVLAIEYLLFMGVNVVDLVCIAWCEDYDVVFKEMQVVTFKWLETVTSKELLVSLGDGCVFYEFLNVTIWVELIIFH
jgi:hypothetical protein